MNDLFKACERFHADGTVATVWVKCQVLAAGTLGNDSTQNTTLDSYDAVRFHSYNKDKRNNYFSKKWEATQNIWYLWVNM